MRPSETALVVVDLMDRIVGQPTHPHAGTAVLGRTLTLIQAARRAGAIIALVRTERPDVDVQPPGSGLSNALLPGPGDLEIVKSSWGAFHSTPLDALLKNAGVRHLWLCGISTNHGVESTARAAIDIGYDVLFVEDCMTGLRPGHHEFAVREIFPMLGQVSTSSSLLEAMRRTSVR